MRIPYGIYICIKLILFQMKSDDVVVRYNYLIAFMKYPLKSFGIKLNQKCYN